MGAPAAEGESDRYFRELLAAECAKAEDRGRGEGLELGREQGREEGRVDAVRSLLDGHVVLSRSLASEGWYPPIEILDSVSRLMPAVASVEHRESAALVRRLLAAYARSEDLVRIGAYKAGADEDLDRALRSRPALREFLAQSAEERMDFSGCVEQLGALADEI